MILHDDRQAHETEPPHSGEYSPEYTPVAGNKNGNGDLDEQSEIILSVRNLSKFYGLNKTAARKMLAEGASKSDILRQTGVTIAVNDVSFDVEAGKVFVLIGLSGSGKSTVVRCINMLQRPTSGEILFEGTNIAQMSKRELYDLRRKNISMVFQSFGLMSHRDVLGNVSYGLEVRGVNKKERETRALETISLVGLDGWEHKSIEDLSGGMKQRVGIARALCNNSDLLLMDEPFSALDPLVRRDMQFELLSIQRKLSKTIVFITHDINEAFKMGDSVGIMRDGRIEQLGRPEDLILNPASDYVSEFLDSVDRTKILCARHIMIKPTCLIRENADPVTALREMRAGEVSSAYVIGRKMDFIGVLTLNAALEARHDGKSSIHSIISRDTLCVDKDVLVSDLIGPASETPLPIAVVDDRGRLEGIVTRAAILSTMS